ncbi:hypothetical protein [Flavobacterium sp. TSSA_36]|uniref:hypothetical protein n=1 Tax=Flavobacterium sp. TSSA_36 TaxID=3447669 RepID=UPI003F35C607
MKINKSKCFFLLLTVQFVFGQIQKEETILHGKIITTSGIFTEIEVVNLVSEKSIKVNANGEFQIGVNVADVLIFVSKNFEPYRKVIHKEDLCEDYITIKMIPKSIELDEVIINQYSNINAKALGIIPKNQKSYTVAERRLKAGSGGIGGLINTFSGRKEMLKKELEIETKESNIAKLKRLFSHDYYEKSFHIAPEKVNAFQYYCVENTGFAKLITTNNKAEILLALLQLAETFNALNTEVEKQ